MSVQKYKNFLSLLATKAQLLVYDDGVLLREHKALFDLFSFYRYSNINETTVANISGMLLSMECDLVLIYTKQLKEASEILQNVRRFDPNISVVLILEEYSDGVCAEMINAADAVLIEGFAPKDLYKKVSNALEMKLMAYKLTHTLSTHKEHAEEEDVNIYIQNYMHDVELFLERLDELIERLGSGELGHEFFCEIADEMDFIGNIFDKHRYTKHIKMIFDELSAFLRIYDFEQVDVSTLVGFDYLSEILKDIRCYVVSFFIDHIFSDVYVFQASLRDTILFMIRRLTNREAEYKAKRDDDVEFF